MIINSMLRLCCNEVSYRMWVTSGHFIENGFSITKSEYRPFVVFVLQS